MYELICLKIVLARFKNWNPNLILFNCFCVFQLYYWQINCSYYFKGSHGLFQANIWYSSSSSIMSAYTSYCRLQLTPFYIVSLNLRILLVFSQYSELFSKGVRFKHYKDHPIKTVLQIMAKGQNHQFTRTSKFSTLIPIWTQRGLTKVLMPDWMFAQCNLQQQR